MQKIRAIVYGLGGVGKSLVRSISGSKGIELVGAVARNPNVIGQDVGTYCGMPQPLGLPVTDDRCKESKLYQTTKADVVLDCTSAKDAISTYRGMRSAVRCGLNVIVASASVTNLWRTHPALAEEIDKECRHYGATFFGIGSVQVIERMILSLSEGSAAIQSIEFTHHADVHAFPRESNRQMFGLGLPKDEYYAKFESDSAAGEQSVSMRKESVAYICAELGWAIDRVTRDLDVMLDESGFVSGTKEIVAGYDQGTPKMVSNWVFAYDPQKRYYDRIVIHGIPEVDAMLTYSPDRGMCTTAGTMKNAMRQAVLAAPGYYSEFSLPFCTWSDRY